MPPVPSITDAQIEDALYRCFGNVTAAAMELGIDPRTVRARVNGEKRAQFAAVRHHSRENLLDISELGMAKQLIDGDGSMIRFHLTQQGRDRGYGNRTQLVGPNDGPIQFAPAPADQLEEDVREALRARLAEERAKLASGESE